MTISSLQIVYAVAGLKAAGKGEFGKRLADRHGFTVLTFSTAIREVAAREVGPDYTVADLVRIADRGRAERGPGYWATPLLRIANARGLTRLVVDGFRNPGEITKLREGIGPNTRLVLVGVTAPFEQRYERARKRLQSGDPLTREGFARMDRIDRGGPDEIGGPPQPDHGQQVNRCMAMVPAENIYCNDGPFEPFQAWIDGHAMAQLAHAGLPEGTHGRR